MTRRPTQCAGHALRGGTFGECAFRQVNVPGVRMYVSAGLGLSRIRVEDTRADTDFALRTKIICAFDPGLTQMTRHPW
jgi:hypothetical protein